MKSLEDVGVFVAAPHAVATMVFIDKREPPPQKVPALRWARQPGLLFAAYQTAETAESQAQPQILSACWLQIFQ
jgi:hypothetical protein